MFTIEKTKNALLRRLKASQWQPIILHIKATGDDVTITPCFYGKQLPVTDADCEWFLMQCHGMILNGSDNLDEIADILNDFPQWKKADLEKKAKLQEFYQKSIEGHTAAEWAMVDKINIALNRISADHPAVSSTDAQLKIAADTLNISLNTAQTAYQLSCDEDLYSDLFKECYGYRPRNYRRIAG